MAKSKGKKRKASEDDNDVLGEMKEMMTRMQERMDKMEEETMRAGASTSSVSVNEKRQADSETGGANILPAVLEETDQAAEIRGECGALIDDHLPAETRKKIQEGQFVELATLLLGYGGAAGSSKNESEKEKDKKAEVVPMTHAKWQAAFNVFMSCYLEVHIDEARALIKYSDNIQKMHDMKADWAGYDRRFRAHRAMVPAAYPWWKICSDLFLTSMATPVPEKKSFRERSNEGKETGACFDYNDNACSRGSRCSFAHKCRDCGSFRHGRYNCPEQNSRRYNTRFGGFRQQNSHHRSTNAGQGRNSKRANENSGGRR